MNKLLLITWYINIYYYFNFQKEWIIYGIIVGVLTILPYMIASSLSKNLNQVSAGKKKRN